MFLRVFSFSRARAERLAVILLLFSLLATGSARAQVTSVPQPRPQDLLPPLPDLESDAAPGLSLPSPPPDADPGIQGRGPRFVLLGANFEGNTVIDDPALEAAIGDVIGKPIGIPDLETLRRRITRVYVDAGFVNSGAVLPDQRITDGIVRFTIVEGTLDEIVVAGAERLDPDYLVERLRLAVGPPLNVNDLQRQLRILLDDPLIDRIAAELSPGLRPGESRLDVTVKERDQADATVFLDNAIQPSVGGIQSGGRLTLRNLSGNSEILRIAPRIARGFAEVAADIEVPVSVHDTRLFARSSYSRSSIVDEPFDVLEIESETVEFGIGVLQHLLWEGGRSLTASLSFDYRTTKSTLLDEPISFSEGVGESGRASVSVVRGALEYVDRSRTQVIAARGVASFGVDLFGATNNTGDVADSQFVSFLGQAQFIRRLGDSDARLSLRGSGQWTADRLLSLERFSVGGANTVRGYREDLLVGDRGWNLSLELQIPLLETPFTLPGTGRETGQLTLVPFVDAGSASNVDGPETGTLVSVGAGLVWDLTEDLEAALFVGRGLKNRPDPADDSIQDIGIHFSLQADLY